MKIIKGLLKLEGRRPYAKSSHICIDETFEVETFDFRISKMSKNDEIIIYPDINGKNICDFTDIITHFFYAERFSDQGIFISVEKGFYPDFWINIFKEEG